MFKSKGAIAAIATVAILVALYFIWGNLYSGKAKAMKVVAMALVDPESAKFEDVKYFNETGSACGYVNSKNRMGGYVGFTPFVVTSNGEVTLAPNIDTNTGSTADKLEAVGKHITYLEYALKQCPESSSRATSPAN